VIRDVFEGLRVFGRCGRRLSPALVAAGGVPGVCISVFQRRAMPLPHDSPRHRRGLFLATHRVLWPLFACSLVSAACQGARGEDATTRAIRQVMEENLAASDAEDMPRLLKTMSREMPNRELFIEETLKEWAAADTSTHLLEIEVLKHSDAPNARTRLPYATVRIVQEMTKSARAPGSEEASDLSRQFAIDQEHPVVEFEALWKREGGKWRLVAGLTNQKAAERSRNGEQ
jgi:hypothetical protein